MDTAIRAALVLLSTIMFGLVAYVPALLISLPIAVAFGLTAYTFVAICLALAGGFWAARELTDI